MDSPRVFMEPEMRDEQLTILRHELGHYVCAKYQGIQAYIVIDKATPFYSVIQSRHTDLMKDAIVSVAGYEADKLCGRKIENSRYRYDEERFKHALKAMNIPISRNTPVVLTIITRCRQILKEVGGREFLEDRAQNLLDRMQDGLVHFFVGDDDYDFVTADETYHPTTRTIHELSPVDFPFLISAGKHL